MVLTYSSYEKDLCCSYNIRVVFFFVPTQVSNTISGKKGIYIKPKEACYTLILMFINALIHKL